MNFCICKEEIEVVHQNMEKLLNKLDLLYIYSMVKKQLTFCLISEENR